MNLPWRPLNDELKHSVSTVETSSLYTFKKLSSNMMANPGWANREWAGSLQISLTCSKINTFHSIPHPIKLKSFRDFVLMELVYWTVGTSFLLDYRIWVYGRVFCILKLVFQLPQLLLLDVFQKVIVPISSGYLAGHYS